MRMMVFNYMHSQFSSFSKQVQQSMLEYLTIFILVTIEFEPETGFDYYRCQANMGRNTIGLDFPQSEGCHTKYFPTENPIEDYFLRF